MLHFVVSHIHVVENDQMILGYIEEPGLWIIDKTSPIRFNNKNYPIKNLHIRGMNLILVTSGLDCSKNTRLQLMAKPQIQLNREYIRDHVYKTQRRVTICEDTKKVLPSFD